MKQPMAFNSAKMAKILFSHSYFYRFDPKQWETGQPYPPLGTIQAASLMSKEGHEVHLFDTALEEDESGLYPLLEKVNPEYFVLYDDGFNYLTKMCLTNMREAAFRMAAKAKSMGSTVIVSSSDSTDHFEQYLNQGADFVLLGEGDETLKELVDAIDKGKSFSEVPGVTYKVNKEVKRTVPRTILKDLDQLPLPAWDLINIDSYREIWMQKHGYFSLNIATTRGCPFKCNWCAKPIYGNRYNSRSPKHVVDEIALLQELGKPDHFWMCDDIFGLKPGWVQAFRDELKRRGMVIKYKIQSRVDLLLKEDTIDALGESGLETVWVGAESGSQRILDDMDKGTQVEQIYEATNLLKKKNIKVGFFLQFGYLGETKSDIQKTIGMVLDLMPDDIGISVSYPLPGTRFYEKVKADLQQKANWTDSDDLDMMFQGTYSSAYYKRLHRYVHKRYRRKQGFLSLLRLLKKPFQVSKKQIRSGLLTFYYIPTSIIEEYRLRKLEVK